MALQFVFLQSLLKEFSDILHIFGLASNSAKPSLKIHHTIELFLADLSAIFSIR